MDGDLYVRAFHGRDSSWYRAAVREKAGPVATGGATRAVSFEPVDGALNDRIDDADRDKCGDSPCLEPMISDRARSATVRVTPHA